MVGGGWETEGGGEFHQPRSPYWIPMHLSRRRFSSAAAAPFSGYVEHNRPAPSSDERCPGVDEEMSSDATVLCQDSEAEDELQSFFHEQSNHLFEARLREQQQQQALTCCARSAHLPPAFEGFPPGASFPLQRQTPQIANGVRFPTEVFQREVFRPRRGAALSWGFQQDLAEYEASLQNGLRGVGGMMYPPQPTGYVIQNERQPPPIQPPRRGGGGRKEQGREVRNEEMQSQRQISQQPPQKQTKSRRRGRRGGRGKKNPETSTEDVPKLEKNLEDELAQEMANHISNKSALAHSFSSLRLHVAGGGTMIILNDKEITAGGPHPPTNEPRSKQTGPCDGPSVTIESYTRADDPSPQQVELIQGVDKTVRVLRPKGCGAYFPPQVLKQLQGDALSSTADPSLVSHPSTPTSGLNVKAIPYTPSDSTQSIEKGTVQQPRGKPGTGCFIPAYSQDPASPEMDPSQVLESVSLVESLACLENSEELLNPSHHAPSGDCEIFEATDLCCSEVSTPLIQRDRKQHSRGAEEVSQMGSSSHEPSHDLIQLIENDDYTTFTSPLHLEETLDGLQAEREAREETEQKLINLQIENEELRVSAQHTEALEKQLQELREFNASLQILLFLEWDKHHRVSARHRKLSITIPRPVQRSVSPIAPFPDGTPKDIKSSRENKKDDQSPPPTKIKPVKSQVKPVPLPKLQESKKALKSERRASKAVESTRKKDMEEPKSVIPDAKSHSHLKSATGTSGVKKQPLRCKSHHRSVDDIGEDVRKNKKAIAPKNTAKHSRAVSSSNAMRL